MEQLAKTLDTITIQETNDDVTNQLALKGSLMLSAENGEDCILNVIKDCVARCGGDRDDLTFCDIGCSDGRVLIMAAMFPQIKKVYGVELSKTGEKSYRALLALLDEETRLKATEKITYITGDAFAFQKDCFYASVDILYVYDPIWNVFSLGLRSILFSFRNIKVLVYASVSLQGVFGYGPGKYLFASTEMIENYRELRTSADRGIVMFNGPIFYYSKKVKDTVFCESIDFSALLQGIGESPTHKKYSIRGVGDVPKGYPVVVTSLNWIEGNVESNKSMTSFKKGGEMALVTERIYPLIYPWNTEDVDYLGKTKGYIYSTAPTPIAINQLLSNMKGKRQKRLRPLATAFYAEEDAAEEEEEEEDTLMEWHKSVDHNDTCVIL